MAKTAQARTEINKRERFPRAANMVIMAEHQAFSRSFDALFSAGMELADKVSAYFGAEGEAEWQSLPQASFEQAAFYEQERKRLGTEVMQIAAWLWLTRALREGDMEAETVALQKKKLSLKAAQRDESFGEYAARFKALPQGFQVLSAEVEHFMARICRMDKETLPFADSFTAPRENRVTAQWQKLHQAFSGQ